LALGQFFYLHFADEPELAAARAPHDPALGKQLRAGGRVVDWQNLRFEVGEGIVTDYLANNYAFRLCSERLRHIIDRNRGSDEVQWLSAIVRARDGTEMRYSILHLPAAPRVLNVSKSIMSGPMIVKACLDASLVNGHRVFSFPNESVRLIVASLVKAAIDAAGCSGIKFSKVPVA
jgi:hypothetical protein